MLQEIGDKMNLAEVVLPAERFKPFPTASDREDWSRLPDEVRDRWIRQAERVIDFPWPALPATVYLDYVRDGNRTRYQDIYFERRNALSALVVGECLEGAGRFLDGIINGIWCICEESTWVVPAHLKLSTQAHGGLPDVDDQAIDLFAAETGALLTWAHYLLLPQLDGVSGNISLRIRREVKRRILDPFLEREFHWMGFEPKRQVNNWNPWIHSNCLTAMLVLERDPARREKALRKAMAGIDRFIAIHHSDGGCDEGPGYWSHAGGSLFDCLELLYIASEGKIDIYGEPLIQEIGRYIYRAHIAGGYFVNFADGDAKLSVAADLLYRFGRRIGDEKLANLGAAAYRPEKVSNRPSLFRAIPAMFNEAHLVGSRVSAPLVRDVWLDGIEFMTAREREGSAQGLFLAAKGGHNSESHNHNDVGQFMVYFNGRPFLIDVGTEEYTAKTFGPDRYSIWTMQSAYHNLPTVNGVQQLNGREHRATEVDYRQDEGYARLALNLAAAYPAEAGIVAWRRECRLERDSVSPATVKIIDRFQLERPSSDIQLSFITTCEPRLIEPGAILLKNERGETLRMEYESELLGAAVERIALTDERVKKVWGEQLYRILLTARSAVSQAIWTTTIVAIES
jgi:hypothetical protein